MLTGNLCFFVKKHSKYARVEIHGDWIDLAFCGIHPKYKDKTLEEVDYSVRDGAYYFKSGVKTILSLGVSIAMPEPFEAHLLPRSSLFLKKGILIGNSVGIIDNDYCGDDDVWGLVAFFTEPTQIKLGERIAQFRFVERMSYKFNVIWTEVKELSRKNRGGFGDSGE